MTTYTVSIGRNVDAEPMSNIMWDDFRSDLSYAVRWYALATVFFEGTGVGEFEGIEEASYTVVFGDPGALGGFRARLRQLANTYNQKCIALTTGETEFVSWND